MRFEKTIFEFEFQSFTNYKLQYTLYRTTRQGTLYPILFIYLIKSLRYVYTIYMYVYIGEMKGIDEGDVNLTDTFGDSWPAPASVSASVAISIEVLAVILGL